MGTLVSIRGESLIPEILANHRECLKTGNESLTYAKQAGELLWQLKEHVKHGQFAKVIRERCGFSDRVARGYMRVANGLVKLAAHVGEDEIQEISIRGAQAMLNSLAPSQRRKTGNARPKPPPKEDEPKHEPALEVLDESEVGKHFSLMLELIGKLIRECDAVKKHVPEREYSAIYDSLDIACREITKWRTKWSKMKVVS